MLIFYLFVVEWNSCESIRGEFCPCTTSVHDGQLLRAVLWSFEYEENKHAADVIHAVIVSL